MSFLAGWSLEWRTALARRRLFVLNLLIPLVLVVPVVYADAPPVHAAAIFAVLFVLFGTFGAAIPLLRDAERGFIRRVALTPLAPAGVLLGRTAATTTLDVLQLLPAAALAGALAPGTLITLVGALAFANLFGTWVAAAVRSIAEGALFCAVGTLFLLHASGVFRTPTGALGRFAERVAPYRALHERLLAVDAPGGSTALAVGVVVFALLTALSARPLLRALARADARGRV